MSEALEIVINVLGGLLEIAAEVWLGDLNLPDTKTSRIVLSIIILMLGGLIWWKIR